MQWLLDIGRWLARAYAYLFYVLRRPFKAMDDRWADFKAGVILTVALLFAAISLANCAAISAHHQLVLDRVDRDSVAAFWIAFIAALAAINTYTLRALPRFEQDFQRQSRAIQIVGDVAVWLSVILAVAALCWTGPIVSTLPR